MYTSNIFAILGLRSLYFALSSALDKLRLLHYGLAVILAFVAIKMLTHSWFEIPTSLVTGFYRDGTGDLHYCQQASPSQSATSAIVSKKTSPSANDGMLCKARIVAAGKIVAVMRAPALFSSQSGDDDQLGDSVQRFDELE